MITFLFKQSIAHFRWNSYCKKFSRKSLQREKEFILFLKDNLTVTEWKVPVLKIFLVRMQENTDQKKTPNTAGEDQILLYELL